MYEYSKPILFVLDRCSSKTDKILSDSTVTRCDFNFRIVAWYEHDTKGCRRWAIITVNPQILLRHLIYMLSDEYMLEYFLLRKNRYTPARWFMHPWDAKLSSSEFISSHLQGTKKSPYFWSKLHWVRFLIHDKGKLDRWKLMLEYDLKIPFHSITRSQFSYLLERHHQMDIGSCPSLIPIIYTRR